MLVILLLSVVFSCKAQPGPDCRIDVPCSLDELQRMGPEQLHQLFTQAELGYPLIGVARGRLVYLRRSNGNSAVTLLGETWPLGQVWPNRLVRCEVDLDKNKIRFFTLRRKEPSSQPQILEVDYRLPNRGFQD